MQRSSDLREIKTNWASLHGEGMQLELSCEIAGRERCFASFVADEADEALYFELSIDGQLVRIPVSQLESLIADAKRDVHSESWYDKNPVGGNDA
jgi:hypothetical protein